MNQQNFGSHVMLKRRSIKNLILVPRLQLPFALFSIINTFIFVIVSLSVFYFKSHEALALILELTDVSKESEMLLVEIIDSSTVILLLIALIFIVISVFIAAYFSHRMVGPVVQFVKHAKALGEENYGSRIKIRSKDGFSELADELNNLAKKLEQTKNRN